MGLILTICATYVFIFMMGRLWQWGNDEERYENREIERIRSQRYLYNQKGELERL